MTGLKKFGIQQGKTKVYLSYLKKKTWLLWEKQIGVNHSGILKAGNVFVVPRWKTKTYKRSRILFLSQILFQVWSVLLWTKSYKYLKTYMRNFSQAPWNSGLCFRRGASEGTGKVGTKAQGNVALSLKFPPPLPMAPQMLFSVHITPLRTMPFIYLSMWMMPSWVGHWTQISWRWQAWPF